MSEIVMFGETMIRLLPPGHLRLEQTTSLNLSAGGAEAELLTIEGGSGLRR